MRIISQVKFLTFAAILGFSTHVIASDKLFSYDKKEFSSQELSPSALQALFDIDFQRYRQIEALAEQEMMKTYFAEKAKKSGKSVEEIEVDELKASPPSDKELKAFFEENKAKLPPNYTFDQVKPEIQRFLAEKKSAEKREKLIDSLKKSRGFKILMPEPQAPVIDISSDGFFTKGKKSAKVKIVEFADYQCPHCREASVVFEQLMQKYADKVEYIYIDYPINRSGISRAVAEGAYCAGKQNKYWEFHQMAFREQTSLTKDSPLAFAQKLKLDEAALAKCLSSADSKSYVSKGMEEGQRVGVSGTPSIYINGRRFAGAHTLEELKKIVEKNL